MNTRLLTSRPLTGLTTKLLIVLEFWKVCTTSLLQSWWFSSEFPMEYPLCTYRIILCHFQWHPDLNLYSLIWCLSMDKKITTKDFFFLLNIVIVLPTGSSSLVFRHPSSFIYLSLANFAGQNCHRELLAAQRISFSSFLPYMQKKLREFSIFFMHCDYARDLWRKNKKKKGEKRENIKMKFIVSIRIENT